MYINRILIRNLWLIHDSIIDLFHFQIINYLIFLAAIIRFFLTNHLIIFSTIFLAIFRDIPIIFIFLDFLESNLTYQIIPNSQFLNRFLTNSIHNKVPNHRFPSCLSKIPYLYEKIPMVLLKVLVSFIVSIPIFFIPPFFNNFIF